MSSKISLASCAEIPKALASWLAEGLRPWFSSRSAISRSTNWSAPEAIGEQLQASGSLCMRPNSTNFWARHETHECPCLQTMEKNSRGIMPIHGYITPKSRVFHGLCFGCAFALPQGCFPLASHQASKPPMKPIQLTPALVLRAWHIQCPKHPSMPLAVGKLGFASRT